MSQRQAVTPIAVATPSMSWVDATVHWAFGTIVLFGVSSAIFLNMVWSGRSLMTSGAATALVLVLVVSPPARRGGSAVLARIGPLLDRLQHLRVAAALVTCGVMLRALWVWLVPPIQLSDMAAYYSLGVSLATGGDYRLAGDRAFWPPGLPVSLVPALRLLGVHAWVPAVNNIILFVVTAMFVFATTSRVAGRRWAIVALAVISFWPNWILLSGLASKELLLAALLSLAAWLYQRSTHSATSLAVGFVCGAMALTQPSALTIPAVFIGVDLIRGFAPRLVVHRTAALVAGAVIVVAPWTIRNYSVLGAFVPVSTNGGVTLWVGNNPGATGAFGAVPARFQNMPEVDRSRVASNEALDWMHDNPGRVTRLALTKQALFWADDAKGAYESFRRPNRGEWRNYVIAKGVSNLFWVAMLVALAVAASLAWPMTPLASPVNALITVSLVYFAAFQLVFEGDGRFHTALMPLFAMILAMNLAAAERGRLKPAAR